MAHSKSSNHVSAEVVRLHGGLPQLQWELEQVMTRVKPSDLSAAEVAALLDILRPAHCRVIGGPVDRPGLHSVRDCGE
jgi:hypothetical protein